MATDSRAVTSWESEFRTQMKHGETAVRLKAVAVAQRLTEAPIHAVRVLCEALGKDPEPKLRRFIVHALAKFRHKAAVPTLCRTLVSDDHAGTRAAAADALGKLKEGSAVPALCDALGGDDCREVRVECAFALAKIGSEAASSVPTLITALRDSAFTVRAYACLAIRTVGPAGKAAIPFVRELLQDERSEVRHFAAATLVHFGMEEEAAIRTLFDSLGSKSPNVSNDAARTLSKIRPKTDPSVSVLCNALRNEDPLVRYWAAKLACLLGNRARKAVPELAVALFDGDPAVKHMVGMALDAILPMPPTLEESGPLSERGCWLVDQINAIAIEGLRSDSCIPAFLKDGPRVRLFALVVLRRIVDGRGVLDWQALEAIHPPRYGAGLGKCDFFRRILREEQRILRVATRLLNGLDDIEEPGRSIAVDFIFLACVELGSAAKPLVKRLGEVLRNSRYGMEIRRQTLNALHATGAGADEAVPAISACLVNGLLSTEWQPVERVTIGRVTQTIASGDQWFRFHLSHVLKCLGAIARSAIADIIVAQRTSDDYMREVLIETRRSIDTSGNDSLSRDFKDEFLNRTTCRSVGDDGNWVLPIIKHEWLQGVLASAVRATSHQFDVAYQDLVGTAMSELTVKLLKRPDLGLQPEEHASIWAYFSTIIRNLVIDSSRQLCTPRKDLKRGGTIVTVAHELMGDEIFQFSESEELGLFEIVEMEELRNLVLETMAANLDELAIEVMRLRAEEGHSFVEIGRRLGITPKKASRVFQRSCKTLRDALSHLD